MAKSNNTASEKNNTNPKTEANVAAQAAAEAEKKRLALIEKRKAELDLNESKGQGPKVKVDGVEVCVRSCGNCKWLKTPDEQKITCAELGVTADLLPCSLKKSGAGYFTPRVLTDSLIKAKEAVGALSMAELLFVEPMLSARREGILSEGITGFSIGDKVEFVMGGNSIIGEVDALTRTHVSVVTEKGKTLNVLPGSLKKLAK